MSLPNPQDFPPPDLLNTLSNSFMGASLPNAQAYRLAPRESDEIERQITQLLESGHIQPSSSPCASLAFIIPKKDDLEWRLVTDYRALNKIMVKNRYPLPRIEDLMDHLHDVVYFTKMDLTMGYHQVRMHSMDTWKTAFKTKFGLFEWLVMPFGLTNAPTTFMRLINDVFHPLLGKIVVIYLDDILIFSRSWEEHMQHVCQVLELLRTHKLQVKEKKSFFGQKFVQYLGFIVDMEGIRPDPTKVQALAQWPMPTSTLQLKSFMEVSIFTANL
jgi:hypothetical protein